MKLLTASLSFLLMTGIASGAFSQVGERTQPPADGSEVQRLEQRIAVLTAKCRDLERQNALLVSQLNKYQPAGADVAGSGVPQVWKPPHQNLDSQSIVLKVSTASNLSSGGVQKLKEGCASGNLHLNPMDSKLRAEPVGLQKLRLLVSRTSRGLGTQSFTEAGTMWVKQGSLYLQWAPGDQSEAYEALRYSTLVVGEGPTAQKYVFTAPVDVSVPMTGSKLVDLPPALMPTLKIAGGSLPGDWKATPSTAGCDLILTNSGLKAELKLEPSTRTLTATVLGKVIDPVVAKRHLDQVNAAYARHEDLLQKMEDRMKSPPHVTPGYHIGTLYYPETVEDRSQLVVDIATTKDQLKTMGKLQDQLQTQLDSAQKQAAVLAELQGSSYTLTLPNDVVVAQVTLVAPGGEPAVPVKKGAVHAGSTSHR